MTGYWSSFSYLASFQSFENVRKLSALNALDHELITIDGNRYDILTADCPSTPTHDE